MKFVEQNFNYRHFLIFPS